MNVLVTTEERFLRTADGTVWSAGSCDYQFWQRYLDVFEQVHVVARVARNGAWSESWRKASGEAVTFHDLPCYRGVRGYVQSYIPLRKAVGAAMFQSHAVILRVSSAIANLALGRLRCGHPYALEVVGDPYGVFAPGVLSHPLRPLLRWMSTTTLAAQCRGACAVAYVSENVLRKRYPAPNASLVSSYSSIDLGDDAFVPESRSQYSVCTRPVKVVSVGTLEVPYKGFDDLIDAVAICLGAGINVNLVIIGEGRLRQYLEKYAQARQLGGRIQFTGRLSSIQIREELDRADLFVLASKTEGLPRAMIEAMARAVPCVGTAVGGIPELLDTGCLVPPGNPRELAIKITQSLRDPVYLTVQSAVVLKRARNYHSSTLSHKRRQFYLHVKEMTRRWQESGSLSGSSRGW
jgi:phosphatidylinositol alpha-1,6-mannosyltransferase